MKNRTVKIEALSQIYTAIETIPYDSHVVARLKSIRTCFELARTRVINKWAKEIFYNPTISMSVAVSRATFEFQNNPHYKLTVKITVL